MTEHEATLRCMGKFYDEEQPQQAACLAGAEALRLVKAYDDYMQSHYSEGATSSALHPDAAKMWSAVRALLATEVTRVQR